VSGANDRLLSNTILFKPKTYSSVCGQFKIKIKSLLSDLPRCDFTNVDVSYFISSRKKLMFHIVFNLYCSVVEKLKN
jgi:hypothetical protein